MLEQPIIIWLLYNYFRNGGGGEKMDPRNSKTDKNAEIGVPTRGVFSFVGVLEPHEHIRRRTDQNLPRVEQDRISS